MRGIKIVCKTDYATKKGETNYDTYQFRFVFFQTSQICKAYRKFNFPGIDLCMSKQKKKKRKVFYL